MHVVPSFNKFGYPQQIHSDSGSQFTSAEFKDFLIDHNVKHTASSPHYHQSNGKAERFVQMIKQLSKKTDDTSSICEALLIYRSTPLTSKKKSPGELMLNRLLKTNLVSIPLIDDTSIVDKPTDKPSRFSSFYPDDTVFVYNTLTKIWEKGRIVSKTDQPDQYRVLLSSGHYYIRNRIHIKPDTTNTIDVHLSNTEQNNTIEPVHTPDDITTTPDKAPPDITIDPTVQTPSIEHTIESVPDTITNIPARRSSRHVRQPEHFKDYVPS